MPECCPSPEVSTTKKLVSEFAPRSPCLIIQEKQRGTIHMQVLYPRCAGLDIHKKTVVACVMLTAADGSVQKQTRTFSTMTSSLLALDAWLHELQVDQIAMES